MTPDGSMSVRLVLRALFRFEVFQPDAAPRLQAFARLVDSAQKARVVCKTILEPVVLRLETDQHPRRSAMAGNDDLLPLSLAKKAREIILDCGQRNFFHSRLANCASHASASDLATIAKTSTVVPDRS